MAGKHVQNAVVTTAVLACALVMFQFPSTGAALNVGNDHAYTRPFAAAPHLLIYYHKSGHHLTRQLGEVFDKDKAFGFKFSPNDVTYWGRRKHDNEGCPVGLDHWLNNWVKRPHAIQSAPDFFCDTLEQKLPPNLTIVHFVRDPFDMVVSGYRYHTRNPVGEPALEDTNPCAQHKPSIVLMTQQLQMKETLIHNVDVLCQKLYAISGGTTFYDALSKLPPEKGVKLEAARALISRGRAGGDVLRMVTNVVRLRQDWPRTVTTTMIDWTDDQAAATSNLLNALLRNIGQEPSFYSSEIQVIKREMVAEQTKRMQEDAIHFSKTPGLEITMMHEILSSDPDIGPVLRHLKRLMPARTQ
eukprot:m.94035 g.94035  ORF g.94035 m.94035 type:complete len:356 (-) comp26673_c1_seq1:44-1111(-)